MKILHIFKAYPPVVGGIEYHIRALAEAQQRRGCTVTVLAASARGRSTVSNEAGVRVIRTRSWGSVASTPISPELAGWVRRLKTDVTHLHHPYPIGEWAHHVFGRATATIVTYHSEPVRYRRLGRVYRPFIRRLLRRADRVLVTTDAYLRGSPLLRPCVDRCSVVPLGIDPRPFSDLKPAPGDGPESRPAVLFVGRLRHYKGVEVLIDAASSVDADFRIVGAGPMAAALRQRAAASAASERIRFFGQVPDAELPALYAAAAVVVLPSVNRSEAFGLVMLEAMAASRPVVSTELGTGTSVVNQHGETGLVVPPHDAVALAGALVTLLGDPERRAAMGEAGRRRVASQFHVDTMADRVVEIYRHTLAVAGGPPATVRPRAS